jgi:hypothetical protein
MVDPKLSTVAPLVGKLVRSQKRGNEGHRVPSGDVADRAQRPKFVVERDRP